MFIYKSKKSGHILELKHEIKAFKGRLEHYVLIDSILTPEEIEEHERQKARQEYKDKIKQERLNQGIIKENIIIEEILEDE